MNQQSVKIAFHETGHALMGLLCHRNIRRISLKHMDSPIGSDKYLAFVKFEPENPNSKFTLKKGMQKVMISLAGYASEILFFDGRANIGGDDLTIAIKTTLDMFQVPEFRTYVTELPVPNPGVLDMVDDHLIRAYIDFNIGKCVEVLAPYKNLIYLIADELCKKEELSGEEFTSIVNSYTPSRSYLHT